MQPSSIAIDELSRLEHAPATSAHDQCIELDFATVRHRTTRTNNCVSRVRRLDLRSKLFLRHATKNGSHLLDANTNENRDYIKHETPHEATAVGDRVRAVHAANENSGGILLAGTSRVRIPS
jgi:hypothetical protein